METKSILRAVVFGGGIALLANPVWAGGGAYGHDRNQAAQERTEGSGPLSSGHSAPEMGALDQEQTREIQQALHEKGFAAGSDGMMDSKTREAIAQFQLQNNIPATGTVDGQTAEKLGVEISSSQQRRPDKDRVQPEPRPGDGQLMEQG